MQKQAVREKFNTLPQDLQKEVLDYIEFLLKKHGAKNKGTKFKFNWAGGLSELKNKYTSVELQHKAKEWR